MGPDRHCHSPRCRTRLRGLLRALGFQHGVDLLEGVGEPGAEIRSATILLQEVETECAVPLLLIDVGDGAHEWAQNDFSVVFEKVDLEIKEVIVVFQCSKFRKST